MPGKSDPSKSDGLVMMHDLIAKLLEDVINCYALLETDRSSQFLRRSTARAIFSYIEAMIEAIRNELRSDIRTGVIQVPLTSKDEEVLVFLEQTGTPSKLLPLDASVKRTFKLAARLWGLDFTLDTSGDHFRDFLEAKSARNKLTHPRTAFDIEVTDLDMEHYTVAGQWIQSEMQRLFKARQNAILAQMSPEARAAFLKMQEVDRGLIAEPVEQVANEVPDGLRDRSASPAHTGEDASA